MRSANSRTWPLHRLWRILILLRRSGWRGWLGAWEYWRNAYRLRKRTMRRLTLTTAEVMEDFPPFVRSRPAPRYQDRCARWWNSHGATFCHCATCDPEWAEYEARRKEFDLAQQRQGNMNALLDRARAEHPELF